MAKFVIYKDVGHEYRWRFKANNGQVVAVSGEGYVNKSDCIDGIKFVKVNSPSAPVEDLTWVFASKNLDK